MKTPAAHKVSVLLVTAALLVLATGCADFKTYMRDRGNDLADCFMARMGTSYGFGLRTQVTDFFRVSAGFGTYEEDWVGYLGRDSLDYCWKVYWAGLPLSIAGLCTDVRWSIPCEFLEPSLLGVNFAEFCWRDKPYPAWTATHRYMRETFFVEFGATLGLVGFDVGFNPVEFADFLLGWFGLDIATDDARNWSPPEQRTSGWSVNRPAP